MIDAGLIRFLEAQDQIYGQVVDELAEGRKKTDLVVQSWSSLGTKTIHLKRYPAA